MAKPRLEELFALPDVLQQDNFEIVFTKTPTIVGNADIRNLRIQCMNVTMPGRTLETAPVNLFGHEIHFAGRTTVTHTFQATFVETRAFPIHRPLYRWMEYARDSRTQHGASKEFYCGTAEVTVLSEAGIPVAVCELLNMYPETLPETNFDGSATGIIQLPVTFKYDQWRWQYDGGAPPSSAQGGVG